MPAYGNSRRTCCWCFSVTCGVYTIGFITFLGAIQGLMSINSNKLGWIDVIFRAAMLPLFVISCWKRERLDFRKWFAILFASWSLLEIVVKISLLYYIYKHTDTVEVYCKRQIIS